MAYSEKDLLERIRRLEEQNSALQDKLDMIWGVLAPDYDVDEEDDAEEPGRPGLVQIESPDGRKPKA